VSTTSCLNSGVYRLFGTPFGIKITPLVIQYIIPSNKWGAVHFSFFLYLFFYTKLCQLPSGSVPMKNHFSPNAKKAAFLLPLICSSKISQL
ncbi:hypothetical protein, partial [Anaerotignum lactatifermentans]|uniref:hypothetical protein n=1 Tax=Anaerotignum lactatifermentans TaxID=160404 RepID=UPI003AB2084B